MKHLYAFLVLFLFSSSVLFAQSKNREINLVKNGDFEDGNYGFTSEFSYNFNRNFPGQYSITNAASRLNSDFLNPVGGDHTYGSGFYFVLNSDEQGGKKAWSTTVNVVPNSTYKFGVYYCNLFKDQPVKTGFAFESGDVQGNDPTIKFIVDGKQVGELDRDYYHIYRWIYTTATWYSGKHNGSVTISIENANKSMNGNDLAMDDIEFSYIETMPDDYVPPGMRTVMSAEYREEMAKNYKPSKRVISFADIQKGDELAPGIYTIKYRPQSIIEDTLLSKKGAKFQLHNLVFTQGEPEISSAGKVELDRLANWMESEETIKIRVEGHTDNVGKQELNLKLSQERVYNVKLYLMKKGIAEERIETIGYGGALPIADNSKEASRKLNRRVEFEIIE
ncbi:MAG TPA: OmpA family protein [Cytophagaceae bacterium]|jgi:outer membrane protein OmpA-like peptidoglycan-associated protein|nr:OmpA family protein [Cytophagaceae bacterium]